MPSRKRDQANYLDLTMKPGKPHENFYGGSKREWTPAYSTKAVRVFHAKIEQVYKSVRPIDIETECELDVVAPGKSGNIPQINYGGKGGWEEYKNSMSILIQIGETDRQQLSME